MRRTVFGVTCIAAGAVALAAVARLHHDLAIDEPFTALAIANPAALRDTLVHDNAPLFYGLLLAWTRLFGTSALALRALSLAAFGGAIVFTAMAARTAASVRAAWLTACLAGCSVTFGLEPAATARPYALAMLFSAAALWAAVRAMRIDGPRAAVPLALAHLLGLFTHPVFAFVTAASAVAGLVWDRRRVALYAAPAAALGVYAVTWGPALRQTAALPARSWMTQPAWNDLAAGMLFWGDHATLILAGVVVVLFALRRRYEWSRLSAAGFGLTIAALVLIGAFAASRVEPVYLPARTPIFALPAIALAFGVAVAETAPAIVALAAALLVAVSAGRHTVLTSQRPDPFPTRASLAAVASRAACGDTIVATGLSYASISYYAAAAGVPACVRLAAFPESVRQHPGWLDMSTTAAAALPSLATSEGAALPATGAMWVFVPVRGVGAAEGAALTRELSTHRRPAGTLPLRGSFFEEVRLFEPQ